MSQFEVDPHDELYEDDTVEVEVEYPREIDYALEAQLIAYYESFGAFDEEKDALGS